MWWWRRRRICHGHGTTVLYYTPHNHSHNGCCSGPTNAKTPQFHGPSSVAPISTASLSVRHPVSFGETRGGAPTMALSSSSSRPRRRLSASTESTPSRGGSRPWQSQQLAGPGSWTATSRSRRGGGLLLSILVGTGPKFVPFQLSPSCLSLLSVYLSFIDYVFVCAF